MGEINEKIAEEAQEMDGFTMKNIICGNFNSKPTMDQSLVSNLSKNSQLEEKLLKRQKGEFQAPRRAPKSNLFRNIGTTALGD